MDGTGKINGMLSEEELLKMLLHEDETFHDEGRDYYFHEVMEKMRNDLGTSGEGNLPGMDNVVFGRKKAESVGAYVKPFGKKALLVTGKSTIVSGLRERILGQLEQNHVEYALFEGVGSNPTTASIDEGAAFARENGCDVVLAVGGGSQIDAAKAMALVAANGGSVYDYTKGQGNDPSVNVLPVIAVPTTCGTGSEVNGFSVLTNSNTHDKAGMGCKKAVPKIAIVDPELMETMPKGIMASVSFDALCHLVESYVSSARTEETDLLCRKGLNYMAEAIVRANDNIRDVEALDKVTYASTIAGITIYNAGTTAPHALEHPLSGLRNIAHGRGLAAVSPEIYRRSAKGCPERFAEISRLFGGKDETDVHTTISKVLADIGLETTLSGEGFEMEDISWLTESAVRTAGTKLTRNPVVFDAEEIREIYETVF